MENRGIGVIELNADIGEGCDDAGLMPYLTRVSIACGGHAGDAASMAAALRLAGEYGVMVGAHPGYPDRTHFGRRPWTASANEIAAWVTQQTEALAEQAARLGLRLVHVKPHGALYNAAAVDPAVAQAIAGAVAAWDPTLTLVGLSGSSQFDYWAVILPPFQFGEFSSADPYADEFEVRKESDMPCGSAAYSCFVETIAEGDSVAPYNPNAANACDLTAY